jgi:hypothetical protein
VPFRVTVVFRIIWRNVSELVGVLLSRPLQHKQEMPPTKPNPIQPQNQILTLQVLASTASLDGTLPLPRVRPDAEITTNNSETLRHLAIKATHLPQLQRAVNPEFQPENRVPSSPQG